MTPGRFTHLAKSALSENPPAILFFGLCPAIAVSVRVSDALWMSGGVILVLVLSNLAMQVLSPENGAGESSGAPGAAGGNAGLLQALVITSFLTACFEAGLLVRAPSVSASLGIYAPLIAVNCLVLSRKAPGTVRPGVGAAVTAALGRGIGFAAALVLIAVAREVLGSGTVTLFPMGGFGGTIEIRWLVDQPVRALGLAGGGLLCLGYLAGAARAIAARTEARSSRGETSR